MYRGHDAWAIGDQLEVYQSEARGWVSGTVGSIVCGNDLAQPCWRFQYDGIEGEPVHLAPTDYWWRHSAKAADLEGFALDPESEEEEGGENLHDEHFDSMHDDEWEQCQPAITHMI
jgi:hypothetical protein